MTTAIGRRALGALALAAALLAAAAGAPAAEIRVQASFDNAYVYASSPDDRYLEIEVAAPDAPALRRVERRPPLNIALVIDKSGSMAEARKIDYVKEAARALVAQLEYGDRFAIVTYDDGVQVPLPSQALEDRRAALRVIDQIWPGGATNLGGGLLEGYRQVRSRFNPDGVNRVLLLSDGLANRGVTSPDELSGAAWREGEGGVSLTTFGVGLEFNEDLLAGLAESGRGTYYYIDQPQIGRAHV
jgi:Ca-activated chloride channel family protein